MTSARVVHRDQLGRVQQLAGAPVGLLRPPSSFLGSGARDTTNSTPSVLISNRIG
jgi:hypothetical protein